MLSLSYVKDLVKTFRSFSFGGIVGSIAGAYIHYRFNSDLAPHVSVGIFAAGCAAIGGMAHNWINAVLVLGICYPIGRRLIYLEALITLRARLNTGMPHVQYEAIRDHLDHMYFIGDRQVLTTVSRVAIGNSEND